VATPLLLYLFNEGTGATATDTSSGTALNATITPGASGAWTTAGTNKVGYDFAGTGTGITGSLSGTKVNTALSGGTKITLELVFDSAASTSTYDEFLKITDGSSTGLIGATVNHSQGGLIFSAAEGAFPNDCLLKYAIPTSGVIVLHIVIDSTQASAGNRVLVYVAGSSVSPTIIDTLGLNAALDAAFNWSTSTLVFGEAGASPRKLYYAAIYASALTSGQVAANATALAANNDADPNGTAASQVPFRRQQWVPQADEEIIPRRRLFVPPPTGAAPSRVPYRRPQPPQEPAPEYLFMGMRSATIQSGAAPPDNPPWGWPRRILALFQPAEDFQPPPQLRKVPTSGPVIVPDNPPWGWPRRVLALVRQEEEAPPLLPRRRTATIAPPAVIPDTPPWGWPRRLALFAGIANAIVDEFFPQRRVNVPQPGFVPAQTLRPPFVAVVDSQQLTVTPDT